MSRKSGRTTKVVPISFSRDVAEYLLTKSNKSEYVNNAVREKIFREKSPEVMIQEIKIRKRELAIQITKLTEEEEKIKEKFR